MAILAAVRDSNTLETDLPKFISIPVSVLHVLKNLVKTRKLNIWRPSLTSFFLLLVFSEVDNKFDLYERIEDETVHI